MPNFTLRPTVGPTLTVAVWTDPAAIVSVPGKTAHGSVTATGAPGTVFPHTTTPPGATPLYAVDSNGVAFDVLVGGTAGGGGTVTLTLLARLGGTSGNVTTGTALTWINPVAGSAATATVAAPGFTGGTNSTRALPSRLNSAAAHPPKYYQALQGVGPVEIKATVGGVEGPMDVDLGVDLFTAAFSEVPIWPAPAITSPAGQSSVASFTPKNTGLHTLTFRRSNGGAVGVHIYVVAAE